VEYLVGQRAGECRQASSEDHADDGRDADAHLEDTPDTRPIPSTCIGSHVANKSVAKTQSGGARQDLGRG
jgi:hypothetical protein